MLPSKVNNQFSEVDTYVCNWTPFILWAGLIKHQKFTFTYNSIINQIIKMTRNKGSLELVNTKI